MHHRVALAAGIALLSASAHAEAPACKLAPIGTGQIRAEPDGATVTTTDNREVRLAGIEAAPGAKFALEQLVLGRDVALFRLGPDNDRYGRIVAILAVPPAASIEQSVQRALLAQGNARVSANIDDMGCAAALLGAERDARKAGLGLWAEPSYVMKNAEDFKEVLAARGRFAVVQGKVISVRESGGTIYINFGRRWSEDFTVTILKRNERTFVSSGVELKKLEGRNVRVRGMIEERGGPWIEAAHPGQIEIAEQQ